MFNVYCSMKGHIVDVVRRKIFDGEIIVNGECITQVRACSLEGENWPYLLPGFIDSHVHIESSMMVPSKLPAASPLTLRKAKKHRTKGLPVPGNFRKETTDRERKKERK